MNYTMNTRPVEWFKYEIQSEGGKRKPVAVSQGQAVFHQFGVDWEEIGDGVGNYSTAIIETPDGTVKNVPAEHIKFLDREGRNAENNK